MFCEVNSTNLKYTNLIIVVNKCDHSDLYIIISAFHSKVNKCLLFSHKLYTELVIIISSMAVMLDVFFQILISPL